MVFAAGFATSESRRMDIKLASFLTNQDGHKLSEISGLEKIVAEKSSKVLRKHCRESSCCFTDILF